MSGTVTLMERMQARMEDLSPTALRVVRYFVAHREEVLISSAAELAAKVKTSDATVIRTARALGYQGLDGLRSDLADELRRDLTPADRVTRTLEEVKGDLAEVFNASLNAHQTALEALRLTITPALFRTTVEHVLRAGRVAIFGIGPSSAIANYFAIQLRRFGLEAIAITNTGLSLADDLLRLRKGDLLLIMAYGRVYPELQALFDHADVSSLATILITDTLGAKFQSRTDAVLQIPRGRIDAFSTHATTLAFLEILLIGIAAQRPTETITNLTKLNQLRKGVTGTPLDL